MKKPTAQDSDQHDRFIATARALECDEDEAAFKAKLAVIARQKPVPRAAPTAPTKVRKISQR